jgi:hypothetical protein
MDYAAWHVAQATTSQSAAADTLARLILSTTALGVMLGMMLVVGFAVWFSARLTRIERCLQRMEESQKSGRNS